MEDVFGSGKRSYVAYITSYITPYNYTYIMGNICGIYWDALPPSNNHHQDALIFRLGDPYTLKNHCWEPKHLKVCSICSINPLAILVNSIYHHGKLRVPRPSATFTPKK